MKDQAELLREIGERRARATAPGPREHQAYVIGSGKGGVGKSMLAVLLASELARRGRRVLLFDGSQNQGNLHVLLGARPLVPLATLVRGEAKPSDLLMPVAERLWLLPADSGAESVHHLSTVDRARLHHRLSALYQDFDAVVVDAGPGIESVVRVASMRAARLVVVAVPEPASLSDAYALIKILHLQVPFVPIDVLVNRTEHDDEGPATFDRLALAARRFLNRELGDLGAFPESSALRRAVRTPGGLLEESPAAIGPLAERLEARAAAAQAGE